MQRPIGRAFGILFVLATVLAAASPPAAAHHTGTIRPVDTSIAETVTLPENNFTGYTIVLGSGETIGYDIRVVSGGNIDVYFALTDGLLNYTSDTAVSIQAYGFENARNVTGTFDQVTGTVTVIVDNSDRAGAIPTGPVTVAVSLMKNTPVVLAAIILIAGGAATLAIVLALVLVRRRRTKGSPAPPPRPYAGPYAPPSQPPTIGEAPSSGGASSPPPPSKDP